MKEPGLLNLIAQLTGLLLQVEVRGYNAIGIAPADHVGQFAYKLVPLYVL